jgi:polyferredoxin
LNSESEADISQPQADSTRFCAISMIESPLQKEASVPAFQRRGTSDFRDHLGTADEEGRRKWLYPKRPAGPFYRARTGVSLALLVIMFGGPFVKINGNPLLMINVVERKFSVLGVIFWPQDNLVFALGLLLFLTGIAVFTAAFGRLWCGWTCPQTVLMEMVFRKIEYWIEGDAHQQRALDKLPWRGPKLLKKIAKQVIFFGLSFLIGNTLLAYIIGIDALKLLVTDDPRQHLSGLGFMVLFALVFYLIFARFREQACTFICPYGRFQSTLLDENTIVVAYDYKRGEGRGTLRRGETRQAREQRGAGDCINCFKCLVRFASLNGIEQGQHLRLTPRIVGYCLILLLLGAGLAALLLTRSEVDATLLRAPGALYQQTPEGKISNLYLLKLTNKKHHWNPVELQLENIGGTLTVLGGELNLPPEKQTEASVLIEIAPGRLVGIYSEGKRIDNIKTIFIGPRR